MNNSQELPDAELSYVRSALTAIDRDLSQLKAWNDESYLMNERLKKNWTELLSLLAIGPEPEYRECPSCHKIVMRLATRCGFCWLKLPPYVSNPLTPEFVSRG